MPRQLKVIASNVTPNAPFRVNWTTPVIIKPGNKIALDKFVGVIPDVTQNFILPQQTFQLYLDLDGVNNTFVSVVIPAGRYPTITNLLEAMTIAANDAFSGYVPGTLPVFQDGLYNIYRDAGLKCQFTSADQKLFFEYNTSHGNSEAYAFLETEDLNGAGAGTDVNNFFFFNGSALSMVLTQINEDSVLLRGGGVLAQLQFLLPTPVQAAADGCQTKIGWTRVSDESFRGLYQDVAGQVFLRTTDVDGISTDVAIPSTWLNTALPFLIMDFYQFNGFFQIRIYDDQTTLFDSTRDGFETALGSYNYYGSGYIFNAVVIKDFLNFERPLIKNTIDMTIDMPYDTPGDPGSYKRTMALDFSAAGQLRAGLGVPGGLLLCSPQNSPIGDYSGPNNINMALINSLFDIALEIIDIPLETYQADDTGFPGSRKNIVAYFRPELTDVGSNTYRFDVNIFVWLDIPITYDLNLTSCSFRLLNPSNNADLLFSSCSFNLLINDKEY